MIWFACKQCGKADHRPAEQAGTLVFCVCGKPNRVPWESTIEARSADLTGYRGAGGIPSSGDPAGTRGTSTCTRPERQEPDPAHCFNHPDMPAQEICAECSLSFCANCLVALRGHIVCGPCKNQRLRLLQRPSRPSVFAILSLVLALLGARRRLLADVDGTRLAGRTGIDVELRSHQTRCCPWAGSCSESWD